MRRGAGLLLMRHWRLPQPLYMVVGRHHEAIDGTGLLPLVQASCVLADTLMLDAIKGLDA
jgi:HD-like signal output (HDOD) protein